ncbi:chlorohydrolase [Tepiditoga spiralis]|uniref:Chlorohydrolase n=1 Tax=Tepiditoga spiralis TaxID=2108365 RepID=A0A7G1G544_9BACT|nr:amidohydrolase family protein [Tepiditoga spiralis]BBE30007.1 chlorohydrolase [Tepiditoga spiralis]
MKAIINANIYDYENYFENMYILYDKKIIEIDKMKNFNKNCDIIDAKNSIVMPGFVNSHTHIYSTFARGLNIPFNPETFKELLEQLWWKLDSKLTLESIYYSGLISSNEFIKNGVTTIIDHHASGEITNSLNTLKKAICDKSGLRGIFCFETSDRFDVDKCIEENIEFSKNNSEKCSGIFGMHASITLSDNTLKKISNLTNLPIHIHVAESLEDEDDCIKNHQMRIIERLKKYDLIKNNSILAHCIHIDENEANLIKKSNSYIVLNPTSNMNNGVGLPDIQMLQKRGIPLMLGNDGLGYNFAKDIQTLLFSMKHKYLNPLAFSIDDLKKIINTNFEYASKILKIKLGKIKKDYVSDFLIVPYNSPTPMTKENADGHIFYGVFDNFRPKTVICNGKILKTNNEIYNESKKVSQKLWNKIQG